MADLQVQTNLNMQRATIEKLRIDNNRLKEELLLENKFSVTPSNPQAVQQMSKLQDEADVYTRKIELEKRKVGLLQMQVKELEGKLNSARSNMGGINASKENVMTLQKQIRVLESRLQQQNVKYNEAITYNKKIRENIDNMRRERLVFDGIYKKLEKELDEKKKQMAKIIEQANQAYQGREHAIAEMAQLKALADKEQHSFEEEWKQLTAIIEQDRKLREAARQREMEERERKTNQLLKSKEQGVSHKKKAVRGVWGIAKNQASQHVSMDKVQQYGEAFAKVQTATGIQDIEELVMTFMNAEDTNFGLFNYVNELNEEIERLEEQIETMKGEIQKYRSQDIEQESQKKEQFKELEGTLGREEYMAEQYEKKTEVALKLVNELKSGIWEIFNKCGCNTPAIRGLLGDSGVTEQNMMQYLGIIEQRTNELLVQYAAGKSEQGETVDHILAALGQNAEPKQTQTVVHVIPPSTNDEDLEDVDGEGEDEKPLMRENLVAKVQKLIAKKADQVTKVSQVYPNQVKGSVGKKS